MSERDMERHSRNQSDLSLFSMWHVFLSLFLFFFSIHAYKKSLLLWSACTTTTTVFGSVLDMSFRAMNVSVALRMANRKHTHTPPMIAKLNRWRKKAYLNVKLLPAFFAQHSLDSFRCHTCACLFFYFSDEIYFSMQAHVPDCINFLSCCFIDYGMPHKLIDSNENYVHFQ